MLVKNTPTSCLRTCTSRLNVFQLTLFQCLPTVQFYITHGGGKGGGGGREGRRWRMGSLHHVRVNDINVYLRTGEVECP